ncbi:MAG: S-layer homology domain-containing protein [Oscillospiraceae bacterium]|nr:S-layer homology domain-containing protein [Oscillospiraceae bacterium]
MKKRISALLLSLCMLISLLPVHALAADVTMTSFGITDAYTDYSFPVQSVATDETADFVDVTAPPEGGATVMIYFSANCGNSGSLVSQLCKYDWIADEHIKIVALETKGYDQASTQSFIDTYAGGGNDYIDFYYDDTNRHMWAMERQTYCEYSLTYPFVVIITESGGVRTIQYADKMMTSPARLYNSLAALIPEFADSTSGDLPGLVSVTVAGTQMYSEAADVFTLVNQNRVANGAAELTYNATLTELAMQRAAEIAVYYSHTRPNGTSCQTVATDIYSGGIGENIAVGQPDAAYVMDSWMNSDGHRANILNTIYTQIGIGCYVSDDMTYWVQLFGIDTTDTSVTTKTTDTAAQVTVQTLKEHLCLTPSGIVEAELDIDKTYTTALINGNRGTQDTSYFTAVLIPSAITTDTNLLDVTIDDAGVITIDPLALGETTMTLQAYEGQTDCGGYRFSIVEDIYYDIILNQCEGGTVTASHSSALAGTTVKIYYTPDSGYELGSHSLARTDGGYFYYGKALNYFQFTMPESDVEFTPVFTPVGTYSISLSYNSEGGSASLSATTAAPGETITLTTSPADGYYLASRSFNGVSNIQDLGNGTYSFTMPKGDVSITLTFVQEPTSEGPLYDISLSYNAEGGSASLSAASAHAGDTVILTLSPNTCYYLSKRDITSGASFSGFTDLGNNQYSFVMPAGSLSIGLTFTANHKSATTGAFAATCTEPGYTGDTVCSQCGAVLTAGEEIPALGHSYNSVTTAPTCTAQGYTTHTCTTCGHIETDSYVDALGHSPVTDAGSAPDCVTTGLTEGSHCGVCQEVLTAQTVIPALGHSYSAGVCVRCGKEESAVAVYNISLLYNTEGGSVSLSAASAKPGDTVQLTAVPNTCYTVSSLECIPSGDFQGFTDLGGGQYSFVMPDNAVSVSVAFSIAHTGVTVTGRQDASCTAPGYSGDTVCTACGTLIAQGSAVPASGHDYSATVTDPTCIARGYTTHTCAACGDTRKDTYTDALGHTCENGTCTRCGAQDPSSIQPTVNPFVDVKKGEFYYDAVLWAAENGITAGYGNENTFCPDVDCTRAQVVTFLWRAAGCPAPPVQCQSLHRHPEGLVL